MIRSRFIFCALVVGLAAAGGNALDRTWQDDQREDEAAIPQIVKVDIVRGDQSRPISFARPRAVAHGGLSVAPTSLRLMDRGVQRTAAAGRSLLSLHTLLLE